jgi:hypothetical protein
LSVRINFRLLIYAQGDQPNSDGPGARSSFDHAQFNGIAGTIPRMPVDKWVTLPLMRGLHGSGDLKFFDVEIAELREPAHVF